MAQQQYQTCADACNQCVGACEDCANNCCAQANLAECTRLCIGNSG